MRNLYTNVILEQLNTHNKLGIRFHLTWDLGEDSFLLVSLNQHLSRAAGVKHLMFEVFVLEHTTACATSCTSMHRDESGSFTFDGFPCTGTGSCPSSPPYRSTIPWRCKTISMEKYFI
jgi:hypothetical protein